MPGYQPAEGGSFHRLTPRQRDYVKRVRDPEGATHDDLRRAVVDLVISQLKLDETGQQHRLMNVLPQDSRGEAAALEARRKTLESHSRIDAWVGMLTSIEWHLYAHLTFRGEVSYDLAHRQFMKWINHHNRVVFGATYSKPCNKKKCRGGLYWVRATERQRRSTIHFHVVVGTHSARKPLVSELAAQRWHRLAGDALVQPYDPLRGGLAYLVKTAVDEQCHIDASDNLITALTPPLQ